MKKHTILKMAVLFLVSLTFSLPCFAVTLSSANYVYRGELYTTPQASVQLKMTAIAVINDFDWIQEEVYGTTDANGYIYLSIYIPDSEFSYLDRIFVEEVDASYNTIASENTSSNSSFHITPAFAVIVDSDMNGIEDTWEAQLADKFCPTLRLHHPTEWIAPEPVEYVVSGKQDLWFTL